MAEIFTDSLVNCILGVAAGKVVLWRLTVVYKDAVVASGS